MKSTVGEDLNWVRVPLGAAAFYWLQHSVEASLIQVAAHLIFGARNRRPLVASSYATRGAPIDDRIRLRLRCKIF
jgi:hypothetical protein